MNKVERVLGIDIAKHQPASLDMDRAYKEAKVRFCIVKATEGSGYIDPLYKHHTEAATKAGMLVGSYHYWWCSADPYKQAEHYTNTAKNNGNMIPVLDIESLQPSKNQPAMAPLDAAVKLRLFVQHVELLWNKPAMIYTYPGFWDGLNLPKEFEDFFGARPLAIAHYINDRYPWIPRAWDRALMYQFDGDKGMYLPDGIDSDFDHWGATEDELYAWCQSGKNPVNVCYPNLGNGHSVAPVSGVALALKQLGFESVRAYQAINGLTVDGVVGPITTRALRQSFMQTVWG